MSYLDQLNSFTGDLNLQHEQMNASLSNLAENLQGQFDAEFNRTIEQMEMAGGAVGTAGIGLSGIHKTFKGFKKWKDARAEKLSKAREDFERSGRATRGGERIDPDLRITESEARDITGFVNEPTPSTTPSTEPTSTTTTAEGKPPITPQQDTTAEPTEEPTTTSELLEQNQRAFDGAEVYETKPPPTSAPELSSADQTIGGSDRLGGYNFEPEGWFDKPTVAPRAIDLDEALGGAEATSDPLPKAPEPQFIRETRTTQQLLPPENTRMRSGTRSGNELVGDEDNIRIGASRNSNVREIETSFDRPNPKYRAPTLEGEGRLQPTTYTDSTIQDGATHIVSDPEVSRLADQQSVAIEDLNRQPFDTKGGKGAEGRGADTNIDRRVGETQDYKGGTTAEAEPEPTGGLPKSGGEPAIDQPTSITQNIREVPPDQLPLDSRGLGTNIGEISAGGEEGAEVGGRVGAEGLLEGGGEGLGSFLGGALGEGLGEATAMGVGGAVLGALGPVAEVVGAGFMIAGLVNDLQSDPKVVAPTLAGGISGKIGLDPSSIAGGGSAGMGTI